MISIPFEILENTHGEHTSVSVSSVSSVYVHVHVSVYVYVYDVYMTNLSTCYITDARRNCSDGMIQHLINKTL